MKTPFLPLTTWLFCRLLSPSHPWHLDSIVFVGNPRAGSVRALAVKNTERKTLKLNVETWHLTKYVDEQDMRFNERKGTDQTRFGKVMGRVVGRRLTDQRLRET